MNQKFYCEYAKKQVILQKNRKIVKKYECNVQARLMYRLVANDTLLFRAEFDPSKDAQIYSFNVFMCIFIKYYYFIKIKFENF